MNNQHHQCLVSTIAYKEAIELSRLKASDYPSKRITLPILMLSLLETRSSIASIILTSHACNVNTIEEFILDKKTFLFSIFNKKDVIAVSKNVGKTLNNAILYAKENNLILSTGIVLLSIYLFQENNSQPLFNYLGIYQEDIKKAIFDNNEK